MLSAFRGLQELRVSAERVKCRWCGRRLPQAFGDGEGNLPPTPQSCVGAWAVGVSALKPGRSCRAPSNQLDLRGEASLKMAEGQDYP